MAYENCRNCRLWRIIPSNQCRPNFMIFSHFYPCPWLIRGVCALPSPYRHAVETLNVLAKNSQGLRTRPPYVGDVSTFEVCYFVEAFRFLQPGFSNRFSVSFGPLSCRLLFHNTTQVNVFPSCTSLDQFVCAVDRPATSKTLAKLVNHSREMT
jgi:hypothetical protein